MLMFSLYVIYRAVRKINGFACGMRKLKAELEKIIVLKGYEIEKKKLCSEIILYHLYGQ